MKLFFIYMQESIRYYNFYFIENAFDYLFVILFSFFISYLPVLKDLTKGILRGQEYWISKFERNGLQGRAKTNQILHMLEQCYWPESLDFFSWNALEFWILSLTHKRFLEYRCWFRVQFGWSTHTTVCDVNFSHGFLVRRWKGKPCACPAQIFVNCHCLSSLVLVFFAVYINLKSRVTFLIKYFILKYPL